MSADWAHGTWEALASTLAEPLRKAFDGHLERRQCGTGNTSSPFYIGGFGNCPWAVFLFDLLPEGDRICVGASGSTAHREDT
jgi:hypothetical protein